MSRRRSDNDGSFASDEQDKFPLRQLKADRSKLPHKKSILICETAIYSYIQRECISEIERFVKPSAMLILLIEVNVHECTIEEVILSLRGRSAVMPANGINTAYYKMCTTNGVDLASWIGAQYQHRLDGAYRHVVKKLFDISAREGVRESEHLAAAHGLGPRA